ncbi:MAG: hypothetical protein ACE5HY_04870 [Candidatus Hydrothermarchaeales archaeon]
MKLGYRILKEDDILEESFGPIQITVWHKGYKDIEKTLGLTTSLKNRGIEFVIHPAGLYMSETRPEARDGYLSALIEYAKMTDMGLIIHDETRPDGKRLDGIWRDAYKEGLKILEEICKVSVENAFDSFNAVWFWSEFANSITFDIGHFESAGMDVFRVIEELDKKQLQKIDYIHAHRNNGPHWGSVTDHWPLTEDCREVEALLRLLELKEDIKVIVEVDSSDLKQSFEALSSRLDKVSI